MSAVIGLLAQPLSAEALVFSHEAGEIAVVADNVDAVVMHGVPAVKFALTGASAEEFADLTGALMGETLTVSLCGHTLVRAVVRERLSGTGIVNLETVEQAVAVANVLSGDADCAALSTHFPD